MTMGEEEEANCCENATYLGDYSNLISHEYHGSAKVKIFYPYTQYPL